MEQTPKQMFKWALERFRDGSKKSDNAQKLFDIFYVKYQLNDADGMAEMVDKLGIARKTRLQKSDWDSMSLGGGQELTAEPTTSIALTTSSGSEQAGIANPMTSLVVATSSPMGSDAIVLRSAQDDAKFWRDRYFELQSEFTKKEKEWAEEDKQTAVAEALLQTELKMKTEQLEEAKKVTNDLLEERIRWAAAVGRRDGALSASTTRLQELDKQTRAAEEARQDFWAKRKAKELEYKDAKGQGKSWEWSKHAKGNGK